MCLTQRRDIKAKIKRLVLTALLFALAIILSAVEYSLPPLFPAIPGIKLGLSNIVVMYALFFVKKGFAFGIAFLKGFFVFITKGMVAGLLSLIGGFFSILIMTLLLIIFADKISYLIVSVFGGIFHNIGQITGICIIYKGLFLWSYAPLLITAGTIAGIITATMLRFILPAVKKYL